MDNLPESHPLYRNLANRFDDELFKLIAYCQNNKIQIETIGWFVELGTCQINDRQTYYVKRHPENYNASPVFAYFTSPYEWLEFVRDSHYCEIAINTLKSKLADSKQEEIPNE